MGYCIWITGLSGSGKTTLAQNLKARLTYQKTKVVLLDGDDLRSGVTKHLTMSDEGRTENIRIAAEVTKLLIHQGLIVIASFVSPSQLMRDQAQEIIGKDNFYLVHLSTSLEVCIQRDVKGLYKANPGLMSGQEKAPYEDPINPNLKLDTNETDLKGCTDLVMQNTRRWRQSLLTDWWNI